MTAAADRAETLLRGQPESWPSPTRKPPRKKPPAAASSTPAHPTTCPRGQEAGWLWGRARTRGDTQDPIGHLATATACGLFRPPPTFGAQRQRQRLADVGRLRADRFRDRTRDEHPSAGGRRFDGTGRSRTPVVHRCKALHAERQRLEQHLGAAVAERVLNARSIVDLRRIVDDIKNASSGPLESRAGTETLR